MNRDLVLLSCALALTLGAAVIDVQQQRIPNWLTYPGIVTGIFLRSIFFGWKGLLAALAGCVFAGGVMFLFYLLRAMGAGDVKLLAAVGSLVGPQHAVEVLLATAVAGGLLALLVAFFKRQLIQTLRNVASVISFHFWSGLRSHPDLNLENPAAARMPYGLAIAVGTLYVCVTNWRR